MHKVWSILLITLLSSFHKNCCKVHIIEPISRSSYTSSKKADNLQHIYNEQCKHIEVSITNQQNAIDMLRALEPLKKADKTITIKAPEHIATVISWCNYVDNVITSGTTKSDAHIEIEDLFDFHKQNEANAVNTAPFISVDETIAALWHDVLVQDPNYKIGVCCQSLHKESHDIHIESFFSLACMQDVSLYSFDEVNASHVPDHINLYTFAKNAKKSFTHVTALIDQLDLIITTQPHIAQLGGALGKSVWFVTSDPTYYDLDEQYATITHFTLSDERNVVFDMMHHLALHMEKPSAKIVAAEIATGELIDKMTILQIKTERISDEKKLQNIWRELESLQRTFDMLITPTPELENLIKELKAANEALWTTEDLIRDKERDNAFDNEFILLARSVYIQNDERCRVKREINEHLGSRLVEEKSYKPYN